MSEQKKIDLDILYNEDCLTTMNRLPENSINLIVTSPPYDDMRAYTPLPFDKFQQIAKEMYRILKIGGIAVWVITDQVKDFDESGTSFRHALYFKDLGFKLSTMFFEKPPRGAVGNISLYWRTVEYMFVISKDIPKTINLIKDRKNKYILKEPRSSRTRMHDGTLQKREFKPYGELGRRTNIWRYNVGAGHSTKDKFAYDHPATFPEKLAEDHILSWSNKNNIIYDPFMGSGTVAKMAKVNGRYFIGSEIDKKFYKIAQRRVKNCQTKII